MITDTDDGFEILVESVAGELPFETGYGAPLSDGIDDLTVEDGGTVTVTGDASDDDGFASYIGTPVYVGDRRHGTLCFCDRSDRVAFSDWEHAFIELLGDWLGHELILPAVVP